MHFSICRRFIVLLCVLTGLTSAARAQVTITVNGTITGSGVGHGYTNGQSIALHFELTDFGSAPAFGVADQDTYYQWVEESTSATPIYANVSGTGLAGSYAPSTAFAGSPYAYLQAHQNSNPGQLVLVVGTNSFPGDMGVSVNGLQLTRLFVSVQLLNFSPIVGSTLPDSTEYFSGFVGTYEDLFQPTSQLQTHNGSLITTTFVVDSVTISAVPEPANFALMVGGAALGCILLRRRRRAA